MIEKMGIILYTEWKVESIRHAVQKVWLYA